jgi:tRNA-binding EMAP/Myf-like protein
LEGGLYLDAHKEGKPTRLKGKSLRGVYNDAMLCSEVELGLGDDADGRGRSPGGRG